MFFCKYIKSAFSWIGRIGSDLPTGLTARGINQPGFFEYVVCPPHDIARNFQFRGEILFARQTVGDLQFAGTNFPMNLVGDLAVHAQSGTGDDPQFEFFVDVHIHL